MQHRGFPDADFATSSKKESAPFSRFGAFFFWGVSFYFWLGWNLRPPQLGLPVTNRAGDLSAQRGKFAS
jgi:hypothetical protein